MNRVRKPGTFDQWEPALRAFVDEAERFRWDRAGGSCWPIRTGRFFFRSMITTKPLIMLVVLPWCGQHLFAQCLTNDTTICTGTIDGTTIEVSGAQSLSGASQCYHLLAGADLDFGGINSFFMLESGATLNVNGATNLVLAKTGSSVSFCGSGYGHHVKHEAGVIINMDCMTGNQAGSCTEVTFVEALSIPEEDGLSALRYDAVDHSLVFDTEHQVRISIVDVMGRTVQQGQGNHGRFALDQLRSGTYHATLFDNSVPHSLRFIVP